MTTKEEAEKKLRELVDQYNSKKAEELLKEIKKPDFKTSEFAEDKVKYVKEAEIKTDSTYEQKEISHKAKEFGNDLNYANLNSFKKVEWMYVAGFVAGLALIFSGIALAFLNSGKEGGDAITNNFLSSMLGGLGVADMALLLYRPIRELQQSRGNISKLSALYNEWQFISAWTGKTYNALNEKLKKTSNWDAKTKEILNEMRWIIELKAETTTKLAKLMTDMKTHDKADDIAVTITAKPKEAEVNSKVELEANVHGISTSDIDNITYSWSEESGKITINNKTKRKAEFKHDKTGEFTIKVEAKLGKKSGISVTNVVIKPKISAKTDPEKEVKKDKEVKLIANVEGLTDEDKQKLTYKWEETTKSDITISDNDKAEAKATPTKEGELNFKVTITKEQEVFATKEVKIKVVS